MKALLQWICFTLIAVTAASIPVRKCCLPGEVLDKSNIQNVTCRKHDGKMLKPQKKTIYIMKLLDEKWNDIQASDPTNPDGLVRASLDQKEFQKIPKCMSGFEIHKLDPGKSDKIPELESPVL